MKLFSGEFASKVEAIVNAWLEQQQPAPTVLHSETGLHVVTQASGMRMPMVTVTVWYSEAAGLGEGDPAAESTG